MRASKRSLGTKVALTAASSLILEIAQLITAVGSSDVTDLIVNTVGGLAGLGCWECPTQAPTSDHDLGPRCGQRLAVAAVGLHIASCPMIPPPHGSVVTIIE